MKTRKKIGMIGIHTVLLLGGIIMLVPFIWMILTAFKSPTEATQIDPFVIFPSEWLTDAFSSVSEKMNFFQLYFNTLLMMIVRIICAVPVQIFIIPQYLMISKIGMLNTTFSLVFPGMVTAFGTFLLRQSYMALPKELEEAALLDGCNIPQTFFYIMAPLTKSGMIALGIFTALFAYKDLMWPLIANPDQNSMPLSSALAKLQGQFSANYPELMAASILACIPMVILYIIFQKQFIEGIATSGGKL